MPPGRSLHPVPLSDKYFLVSCRPTSRSPWGVYLVDVFDNVILLREEEGWMLLEPVPLRPAPRPPVIADRVRLESGEATVHLADVYAGEGLKGIPRGTAGKLRGLEGNPQVLPAEDRGRTRRGLPAPHVASAATPGSGSTTSGSV